MTLKTEMAADLTSAFLNTDEFAESVAYQPEGSSSTATVALVIGDQSMAATENSRGEQFLDATAQATGSRTAIRAAIGTVTGAARDPRRGDLVVVASGANAGTWVVETFTADLGDGLVLSLVRSDHLRVAGPGAVPLT